MSKETIQQDIRACVPLYTVHEYECMEPSHRETNIFTVPVGRNQSHSVWSHTGCSTLLSAGTIQTATRIRTHTKTTDLLYTNSSHGWFSGKAGLEVAQNFLHTLKENMK